MSILDDFHPPLSSPLTRICALEMLRFTVFDSRKKLLLSCLSDLLMVTRVKSQA